MDPTQVIAARTLNTLFIYLDIAFLLTLGVILWCTRRRVAFFFGLAGGLLYFLVDYGIFYLALGTRVVQGADPFWFLLWMSMSYGFTNFVWIWLWLDRDGRALEWSTLIVSGWLAVALLSQNFGAGFAQISIARGTASYHGVMALLLFVGYAMLCVHNVRARAKEDRYPLLWILAIGILVQFGWEFVLLISGVRPAGVMPLIVNSLIETNMGLPYIFFIHRAVSRRWREDTSRIDAA
nr:hypothetical protein [Maliibacterium massiliense]